MFRALAKFIVRMDEVTVELMELFADLVYDLTGMTKTKLLQFLVMLWTVIDLHYCITRQAWVWAGLSVYIFVSCMSRIATWKTPPFVWLRLFCLAWTLMDIGFIFVDYSYKTVFYAISALLYTIYQYLLSGDRNNGERRRSKLSWDKIKELFGTSWIPQPIPVKES